jgi:hypothetical protein
MRSVSRATNYGGGSSNISMSRTGAPAIIPRDTGVHNGDEAPKRRIPLKLTGGVTLPFVGIHEAIR